MSDVLIVGYGVVGHNLAKEIEALNPDIYDKREDILSTKKNKRYKFCFICVDTPYREGEYPDMDDVNDISQVKMALQENEADIYIIKSTILPGTVDKLKEQFNKRIIFSPEYYGGTQHCNNFTFDYTVLGGAKFDCIMVQQLLQNVYDARHSFRIVEAKVAELSKYMENSYLAMKVAFCCQFFEIAEKLGIDYESVRELFVLDPRIEASHTYVYRDHPYFKSHCLDKDVPAIAITYQAQLLLDIIAFNAAMKLKYNKEARV